MSLEQNNKMIALFMGDNYTNQSIPDWAFVKKDFDVVGHGAYEYAKSWDWLMPVVEKINSNVNHYIHNGIPETGKKYNCAVYVCKDFKTQSRNRLIEIDDNTSQIDVTYRAVVEFIKWYEENKTN